MTTDEQSKQLRKLSKELMDLQKLYRWNSRNSTKTLFHFVELAGIALDYAAIEAEKLEQAEQQ